MLPKAYRIVHSKEILQSLRARHQSKTKYFYIKITPSQEHFKLLVIVSKKISKRSVVRNKLRRRVHAVFEHMKSEGKLPHNVNMIVQVYSKDLIPANHYEMEKDLLDGVAKLYFTYINKSSKTRNKRSLSK